MKSYLIGHLPPPYGGVSVYIHRLKHQLQHNGVNIEIIDFSRLNYLKKLFTILFKLINPTSSTFYLNTSNYYFMFLLLFRPFKTRIIFYDHNFRFLEDLSCVQRFLFQLFLRRVNEFNVVEEKVIDYYLANNFEIPVHTNIKNAFIIPPETDESSILESYDDNLNLFLQNRSPLIIANAFKLFFYDNIDLYGLDLCVELTYKLKAYHDNLGFIFALSDDTYNQQYINQIKNKICELALEENFHFLTGSKEIWPLFKKVHLLIRPTNTDGDALSIREALHYNCPVVASNVCKRPNGTIYFRNRDINDLFEKCSGILEVHH